MEERAKKRSQTKEVWRRFKKNKTAVAGLIFLIFILLVCIFADVIVDYDVCLAINVKEQFQTPNAAHWFGTDHLGRDLFARMVHGLRPSLGIGVLAMMISVSAGVMLGGVIGYFGGMLDNIVMRVLDVIMCIPSMLLLLTIVSVLGQSLTNMLLALAISNIPGQARSIRAIILNVSDADYIQSARAYGSGSLRIIVKHVLPNAIGPIIISACGMVAGMILAAAGMSFLGFGIQPPAPEWGVMVSEGRTYMRTAPYLTVIPGMCLVLTALGINLMGDGLRDALDPRLKD